MAAELVRYEAARRALAEAHRVDEVKSIRHKATAMQAYAKQAKDGELIAFATDIRLRAEQRAGELLQAMRERGERQKPGDNPRGVNGSRAEPLPPKLSDLGVTKKESARWQKLAAMPEEDFERTVAAAKEKAVRATEAPPKDRAPGTKKATGRSNKANAEKPPTADQSQLASVAAYFAFDGNDDERIDCCITHCSAIIHFVLLNIADEKRSVLLAEFRSLIDEKESKMRGAG